VPEEEADKLVEDAQLLERLMFCFGFRKILLI
jgi:hypothetical protein